MKKFFVLIALFALAGTVGSIIAGSAPFSGTGTAGTNLEYAVVPGRAGAVARLIYLRASSGTDVASPIINIRSANAGISITNNSSAAATNILQVAGGTSFASNDVVVIYDSSEDTYERALVYAGAAGTVTLSGNTTMVPAANDVIYECPVTATLPLVSAATQEVSSASGFCYGVNGRPILVEAASTNAANLFLLTADYVTP